MAFTKEQTHGEAFSADDVERLLKDYGLWDTYDALGERKLEALKSLRDLAPLMGSTKEDFEVMLETYVRNHNNDASHISYEDRKPKSNAAGA